MPSVNTAAISFPIGCNEETLMEVSLDAGAEDVISNDDGSIDVLTSPDDFVDVKNALVKAGHEPESAEITMRASTSSTLDVDGAQTMVRLLDILEDLDDVQKVYSNADIPDDVLAQLS
jgi:transcriptional/translational regulatory protein YebC/TACO1